MLSFPARTSRLLPLLASLVILVCGAESLCRAEIVSLAFSSDGQYLASLEREGNLYVHDALSGVEVFSLSEIACGEEIAWRPNLPELVVALNEGNGWDLFLLGLDGTRQRLTQSPAQDCCPQWMDGDRLVFAGCRGGNTDLFSLETDRTSPQPFLTRPHDQWGAMLQPHGPFLAFFSQETAEPSLWLSRPYREPIVLASLDPRGELEDVSAAWAAGGEYLVYVQLGVTGNEIRAFDPWTETHQSLLSGPDIRRALANVQEKWLIVEDAEGLTRYDLIGYQVGLDSGRPVRAQGLSLGHPTIGGPEMGFAAIVEGRGVALAPSPDGPFRFLFFDLRGELYLAERLADLGHLKEAEQKYRDLEKGPMSPDDLAEVCLRHMVFLRKQDRPLEALRQIDLIGAMDPQQVDPVRLALLKGAILFLESNRPDAALSVLRDARILAAEEGEATESEDDAFDSLRVLETGSRKLVSLYRDAHRALRSNREEAALDAMEELVSEEGESPLVRRIILDLLHDPYAWESLTEGRSPFRIYHRRQRIEGILLALEDKAARPKNSPMLEYGHPGEFDEDVTLERLHQELFQVLIKSANYEPARTIALRMLEENGLDALGVSDYLDYFLEADRTDVDIQRLFREVLLSAQFAPILEARIGSDPIQKPKLALARIKLSLLEGDLDRTQELLTSTRRLFHELPVETFTVDVARLQVHLYIFAAKRAERLHNWEEARDMYEIVLSLLEKYMPDQTGTYIQLRAAISELEQGAKAPEVLWQMQLVVRGLGDDLLNPTMSADQIRIG
ncbi:hypothetical protein HQ520_14325, partial [bacterium]|nr:hypothetical protein [bacterium]